jgi:multiple antibiotic resistance protein
MQISVDANAAMNSSTTHFVTVFMAFFAVMNPIANSSLFIGLTDGLSGHERRLVALKSIIVAFFIVSAFAIGGRELFSVFGITLPAFRIAGGVIIGIVGFHMLQGEHASFHKPSKMDADERDSSAVDIAITPLGIPVLAGPGTIATAMNYAADSTLPEIFRVLIAFGLICIITGLAFISGPWFARRLGQDAIKVVTRLMGLILSVIGAQMLIDGLRGAGFA